MTRIKTQEGGHIALDPVRGFAGLDDGERRKAVRARTRRLESEARRLTEGFRMLAGEGVYADEDNTDEGD